MSVNTIFTDYKQMSLPEVVDAKSADIPSGTYNPLVAGGTSFTLPGVYGPGDFVQSVSKIVATQGVAPDYCTVEFRNGSGIVGTLYSRLGTAVCLPGAYLGKPLTTSAWIHVSATAVSGTFTSTGSDSRMIVSYVHEA